MAEITIEELRRRYEAGERDFRGWDFSEIELFGTFADADFRSSPVDYLLFGICTNNTQSIFLAAPSFLLS